MFAIFEKEKIAVIAMAGFFGLGLGLRILQGMLYLAIIRETEEMATTKNRLLKQCKLKFVNCYRMSGGVANIPIFVEKFLNRLAVGPLSFYTMYHLSGQAVLLSIVCAGVGVTRGIVSGRTLGEILPFYIVSFLGLYVYFSISSLVDLKGKRQMLKINLIDYLENHLAPRMETMAEDSEPIEGAERVQGEARDPKRTEELRESIRLPRRRAAWEGGDARPAGLRSETERSKEAVDTSGSGQSADAEASADASRCTALADVMGQLTDQELDELLSEFSS